MPALAAVVFAPLLAEDDDLLAALVLHDRGRNPRAVEERLTERDGLAVAHRQHLAELDRLAGLGLEPLHLDNVFRRDAVLLPARANHSEHGNHPCWEARGAPRCGRTIGPACFLSIGRPLLDILQDGESVPFEAEMRVRAFPFHTETL